MAGFERLPHIEITLDDEPEEPKKPEHIDITVDDEEPPLNIEVEPDITIEISDAESEHDEKFQKLFTTETQRDIALKVIDSVKRSYDASTSGFSTKEAFKEAGFFRNLSAEQQEVLMDMAADKGIEDRVAM